MIEHIGQYRLVQKLGEGGMGIVYAAHDERLDRPVAIKVMHAGTGSDLDRERFWREARAIARVNHPNVCQLYEIGEDGHVPFLAMELLEGEALSSRLAGGALSLADAAPIALAVLGALTALHQKGIVHRDLKPSNIFLAKHGVKLLDFGLARSLGPDALSNGRSLTQTGMLVGTPRYMSPEQLKGSAARVESDVFAVGVVLYEMLAGHPPFSADSVIELAHAIMHEEPRALGGSPAIVAVDRVIHRALRKDPEERFSSADAFAQDLRAALLAADSVATPRARQLMRLVVLPFKVLRPDPAIDFLSFSLADAISATLSALPSLVVHSTLAAARFAGDLPDLKAIARELDVDVVLLGSLLHAGGMVRVNAQLVQAPSGTLVRAITPQAPLGDIFTLQDDLARTIVESLSLSVTPSEAGRMGHDRPNNAAAYEFYLRGNQAWAEPSQWAIARDLFRQSLEIDPSYAPAWARLGRCYRLLGKYGPPAEKADNLAQGEAALKRALDLNPNLSLAHELYAHFEVEAGRARDAMVRLLERVRENASQPELFAGLVHACRYCGLLDASIAAYELARRLDPQRATSVGHTFLMKGDYEKALLDISDPYTRSWALALSGRISESLALAREILDRLPVQLRTAMRGTIAALEGRKDETMAVVYPLAREFRDPEGLFYHAAKLARVGDRDGALDLLEGSLDGGFQSVEALQKLAWFDPIRIEPRFIRVVRRAEAAQHAASEAFREADGPRLLGVTQP
jgi:serine/threonine protein kinase